MKMQSFVFAVLACVWSAAATAQPAPVRAFVQTPIRAAGPRLELRHDSCYVWGPPTVAVEGNRVAVSQTVTQLVNCTNGQTQPAHIALGVLAPGSYRLTYTPVSAEAGPLPVSTVDFEVQPVSTGQAFVVEPAFPTAFEPLTLSFALNDSCESVAGFRPIEGGFRVELAGATNQIFCDTISTTRHSIGAYPPGTYRIELGRTAEFGGATLGTLDVVVRHGTTEASRFAGGGEDFSGLWFSPNDEPSTGMTFVHSAANATAGVRATLIGIWYRYGTDGTPRWYWIEATTQDRRNFEGTVFEYRNVDPSARPELRTVGATPVGNVQIAFPQFPSPAFPATVSGTVQGQAIDFRLQRLRWSRAAWPGVPQ